MTGDLTLSMADVANLAAVQRPVVSVWRTRAARSSTPFPLPCQGSDGQMRFDTLEIVEWLETTGRGNNPSARDDVAAFATPSTARWRDDRATLDALTALLCLKALTGGSLI